MKRIFSLIIAILLIVSSFAACSGTVDNAQQNKGVSTPDGSSASDNIKIVATIFPEYDWVMNILGENPGNAEVTLLLNNGVDLHSYQPSAEDILKISTCDVFIYVGGESDAWVDDALKEVTNKDMKVIDLLDILGDSVKEEEIVEGMQEEEHDHEHDEEHSEGEDEHEEGPEYDEHVWLSLKNTVTLVGAISDALQSADGANAEIYKTNSEAYTAELSALDKEYEKTVESASVKTLVFGDRFPFRYMTDDYGITYYAAFVGCSAETEASFETITFLAEKIDELSLKCVMTIEGTDHRIAETIVQSTKTKDQKILSMDSMQSTTSSDIESGVTYKSVMEKNLEVLKEALK